MLQYVRNKPCEGVASVFCVTSQHPVALRLACFNLRDSCIQAMHGQFFAEHSCVLGFFQIIKQETKNV